MCHLPTVFYLQFEYKFEKKFTRNQVLVAFFEVKEVLIKDLLKINLNFIF